MRFVRFGVLKPVRQKGYNPSEEVSLPNCGYDGTQPYKTFYREMQECYARRSHTPPCTSGFYALPFGFCDTSILPTGYTDGNRRIIKLRDGEGNPIVWEQLVTTDDLDGGECLTLLGRRVLKKYGVTKNLLIRGGTRQDSYVRVMRDWRHPPKLLQSGHMNQKLAYLTDGKGHKFRASEIFRNREWSLDDYDWDEMFGFHYARVDEISDDWFWDVEGDPLKGLKGSPEDCFLQFLALRKLDIRQLCVWPIPRPCYTAIYKRPHVFEYRGMLWHHLGLYLKSGEMQGVFQGRWFRSSVTAFEAAMRRYGRTWLGMGNMLENVEKDVRKYVFNVKDAAARIAKLRKTSLRNKPGAYCDTDGMLEVFIEEHDWRNAGRRRS